jgi:alkylation response protein AidB-like acyl-CoA dehydrogenase
MDPGDRKLFAESLRQATEQHTGAALDGALGEIGWHHALTDDQRDAVSLLFELQGAANTTSTALNAVLAQGLGLAPGTSGPAFAMPPLGKWGPPGAAEGDHLAVRGLTMGTLGDGVAIAWGDRETLVAVVPAEALQVRPIHGMDPALGAAEVTADLLLSELSAAPADWQAATAAGRVAIAYELVGACQAMLRLAREHALQRVQFGRPIAGFQAIRHRLADSLVTIEAAQACADAAWDLDGAPAGILAAQLAKSVAGATARTVGKHAQQVLGGMGYTTDHPLHRYVRRALILDQLLGSSGALTREIGAQLLRDRELPELLPL